MTSSRIYKGGSFQRDAKGYLDLPGTTLNYGVYNRSLLSSLEVLTFTVHVKPMHSFVLQSFCGWSSAYASLALSSTNAVQMYFRGSGTNRIGDALSPTVLPLRTNDWVWIRGKVTRASALCEYWYSYEVDEPVAWVSLGSATGTFANDPLTTLNNNVVTIGSRTTNGMLGRIDYFREDDDGSLVTVDLRGADALPTNVTVQASASPPTAVFFPRNREPATIRRGFVDTPGRDLNYYRWTRSTQGSGGSTWEVIAHVCPRALDAAVTNGQTVFSYLNGFTGFNIKSNGGLFIWNGSPPIGNVASSSNIPGTLLGKWIWIRGKVTCSNALCEFWYSFSDDYPTSWTALTSTTGTSAGGTTTSSNSSGVLLGGQGGSPFNGRTDYAAEYISGVKVLELDIRNWDYFPAASSIVTDVEPKVWWQVREYGVEVEDLWIGAKRYHPLGNGHLKHISGNTALVCMDTSVGNLTGDLDARWFGVLNDWAQASPSQALIAKYQDFGADNRSWLLRAESTGVRAWVSTSGTSSSATTGNPVPFTNGQPGGVRMTRVKSTGEVAVWFSFDGVTWEKQPNTVILGAATNLFASTNGINVGGYNDGLSSNVSGKTYWAEVRNGIDGPVVWRAGPETWRRQGLDAFEWTCESGQTVQTRGGTSIRVYPTVTPDDILDEYKSDTRIWPGADGYVSTYGASGNYLTVPAKSAISAITAGFTQIAKVRRHNGQWQPTQGHNTHHLTHFIGSMTWYLGVDGWGGTDIVQVFVWEYPGNWAWRYSAPLPDTDDWVLIAVTFVDTGTGYEIRFWDSLDGVNWAQSGSTWTGSGGRPIDAHSGSIRLLANPDNNDWSDIDCAEISLRQGCGASGTVGGTPIFWIDRESFKVGRRSTTIIGQEPDVLSLNPAAGQVSIPAQTMPTQWIYRMKIIGPTGTGSSDRRIVEQGTADPNRSFYLARRESSALWIGYTYPSGTSASGNQYSQNNGPTITGGIEYIAVKVDFVANTCATYTSTDGVTWTFAGSNGITNSSAYNSSTAVVTVGNSGWIGRIYWIEIVGGTDPNAAGTMVWRFDATEWSSGTSYVDPRGKTWTLSVAGCINVSSLPAPVTVTVNRSSAYPTYTDNFNRADTTTGTGGLGAAWVSTTFYISGNKALKVAGDSYAQYATNLGSPDNWVEAEVSGFGSGIWSTLSVRYTDANNRYMGFASEGNNFMIGKTVSGTYTDIGAAGPSLGGATSGKIRVEVQGTTISLYFNDVLKMTRTDTDLTTGNYVALGGFAGGDGGNNFDNFRCGRLGVTTPMEIYPTVATSTARWGVSQYGDNSKWAV